jgi:hypothetical protein
MCFMHMAQGLVQGATPGKIDWDTGVIEGKVRSSGQVKGTPEQEAAGRARNEAFRLLKGAPDLTAEMVRKAAMDTSRNAGNARRNRANSFLTGPAGTIFKGVPPVVPELPKPAVQFNPITDPPDYDPLKGGYGTEKNVAAGSAVTSNTGISPLNELRRRAKAAGF